MKKNKRGNILIIDDDEDMNNMVVLLLDSAGYEAQGVTDAKSGLALLADNGFDLIVTDIIMPEKEGLETILEIRRTNKTVPIIAISGEGRIGPKNYLELARKIGANFTFQKPLGIAHFLSAVSECLSVKPSA
jgi:DNA-binding response OmpR family regulator